MVVAVVDSDWDENGVERLVEEHFVIGGVLAILATFCSKYTMRVWS